MPPPGARHALAATRGVPTEQLTALRSAAGHVPLDAIADVLSAQPGRRMAIDDLNTVFGTSAPGASAKLAQAALQVAHLVPVPGERPVLVLDEKWRRLASAPTRVAARMAADARWAHHADRAAAPRRRRERRSHDFETRIDPSGAWPTLPTCVAAERAELRQRALVRDARPSPRGAGAAPRGQAHAQHARESISEVRRAVDAALDAPAPHRTTKAATATAARAARPTAMGSRRASAPGVGAGRATAVDATGRRPPSPPRARLEVVLDAVARRVAHPKTGEECFAAAETMLTPQPRPRPPPRRRSPRRRPRPRPNSRPRPRGQRRGACGGLPGQ